MNGSITFIHNGFDYIADVVSSDNLQPHYHWVMFRGEDVLKTLGEDIAFVEREGQLKSIHPSLAKRNQQLLQTIKAALEKHLSRSK